MKENEREKESGEEEWGKSGEEEWGKSGEEEWGKSGNEREKESGEEEWGKSGKRRKRRILCKERERGGCPKEGVGWVTGLGKARIGK